MFVVIANPKSGNGRALKIYNKIRLSNYLPENTKFYKTEYKGHMNEIIKDIESTYPLVKLLFVVGGDGTMYEVTNALSNKKMRIAFIPGGTGNDFARGFDSYKHPKQIIDMAMTQQKEATYWLSTYQLGEQKTTNYFINCFGIGFDAVVSRRVNKLPLRKWLHKLGLNSVIYVLALLVELFFYKPLQLKLSIDGKEKTFNNLLFLTVNNQPYMGGGMKVNPTAINNSEGFSLIIIDSIPKWKILLLFGTVFFGKHILFREVHILKGKEVTVTSHNNLPLPYQVDGEYGETVQATIKKSAETIFIKGIK